MIDSNIVNEAVELYNEMREFWNVAMACGPVAEDWGLSDEEYDELCDAVFEKTR